MKRTFLQISTSSLSRLAVEVPLKCEAQAAGLILRAREFATEPLQRGGITNAAGTSIGILMYAPGGTHTITPGAGRGTAELTLKIDESTAAVLNASLAAVNARIAPQRCFFDKNHSGEEATGWPLSFYWSEVAPDGTKAPGVYCKVEYSSLGREMIDGKVFRAFSPSIFTDADLPKKINPGQHVIIAAGKRGSSENPARIVGLVAPDIGTLTNDPAFKTILPLWAKNRPPRTANQNPAPGADNNKARSGPEGANHIMKKTEQELIALKARKQTLEQESVILKAKDQTDNTNVEALNACENELGSVNAQIQAHDLAVRNETLEQAVFAQRQKDAADAVKAAVTRGAIAPKDQATQDLWKRKCTEDPEMIPILGTMRGNPVTAPGRITINPQVLITREDSLTVLKAYNAEKNPLEKAKIYARDLSKRIADREELPIQASNTLGTLVGELVTQNALELLTLKQPMLSRFCTDFSAEQAKFNQEITSRIVSIPTVTDYNESTGYSTENTTTTDVSVTIDQHKSCQVAFGANELSGTGRRLFEEQSPAMQYAIAKAMVDIALSKITVGNFTETPIDEALVDFNRGTVIEIGGALSDDGVPEEGRTLLLTGSYFDALFTDSAIVSLAAQQKADIITQGNMIPLHGFEVVRTPTLPSTGNLVGFGFSKSALVIAGRLPNDYASILPGASNGVTQVITDARTGMSVMLVQFVDHTLGKAIARVAFMFGAAKGQAKAGLILRSAAP